MFEPITYISISTTKFKCYCYNIDDNFACKIKFYHFKDYVANKYIVSNKTEQLNYIKGVDFDKDMAFSSRPSYFNFDKNDLI